MAQKKAEVVLAFIVLATSTSYLLTKIGMGDMGPYNLIGLRFAIAFLACAPFCWRRLAASGRDTFRAAALLAVLMFALLVAQVYGLATIGTAEASFFSSTTVVMVPLIRALTTGRPPSGRIAGGAALVLGGVGLMTLTAGLQMDRGVWLYLLSALLYAFYILTTDHWAPRADLLAAGVWEMALGAALSFGLSFWREVPRLPAGPGEWGVALGLGVLCSAFGIALQPVVQQYTTPERYGLLFGLGPVFSALLGAAVLGERLSLAQWAGAALVLAGVLAAQREKPALEAPAKAVLK